MTEAKTADRSYAHALTEELFGGASESKFKRGAAVRERFNQYAAAYLANRPVAGLATATTAPKTALSASEIEALKSVGATTEPWVSRDEIDPLADSLTDYVALLETSLSTAEAAKLLKVDASRVRQRLRERSLYGIEYEDSWRLPRFQFERRSVLPGLAKVLATLPQELHPLDVATWFTLPNPDLERGDAGEVVSPREWLLHGGDVEAVVALARGFE
jgi:hypothetical protein